METKRQDHTTTPRLGRYRIDTEKSTVTFKCRHVFGLLPVRGTFTIRTGTVDVAEPLSESSVRAGIETASFTTSSKKRDRVVRSARFLDAARHPVMTFVSDGVDGTTVTGTFTAHGVSQPVSVTIERSDASPEGFTARATLRVDRTRFGVTASPGMAGRHLDLALEIRCVRL